MGVLTLMTFDIVISYFKNKDTIDKLLNSIADQDTKDYTVVIVVDGKEENIEDINYLHSLSNIVDFDLIVLPENKGAAHARNVGARAGNNDILFFIDGDCQLYPGMITECMDQLDDNPDIMFVYGNYRFDQKYEFFSQPFDKDALSTMNYVCTMSPIRRNVFEFVKGFREDEEFFQDWSLFYRVAKAGFKGKYINEFIFSTTYPTEASISGTKGLSLSEKSKIFREKQGIPDRELVVTTFAAPLQARQRALMLDADYIGPIPNSRRQIVPSNLCYTNWKATYFIGCFNAPVEALTNHYSAGYKKSIYHFIGTDVWQLRNMHSIAEVEEIRNIFKMSKTVLLANSPRMVDELAGLGIKAELLYSPIYDIERFVPLKETPKKKRVAVYFSNTPNMNAIDGADGLSHLPFILDIARSMPDIDFVFFGDDKRAFLKKDDSVKFRSKNLIFEGKVKSEDMPTFINSCNMYLRFTRHDGFPHLPIQFMACGRKALVSVPDPEFKFAEKIPFEALNNYGEDKGWLMDKIYTMVNTNNYPDAIKVKDYYQRLMSLSKYKKRIYEIVRSFK